MRHHDADDCQPPGTPPAAGTCGGTGGTLCTVPVTGLAAAASGADEVISWQAPASGPAPVGYVVNVTDSTAGNTAPPSNVPAAAGTMSVTLAGLVAGDSYSVSVQPTGGDLGSIATVPFTGP